MSQIAKLARQAVVELESEEDKQAAVEIRLAAECVIGANSKGGARTVAVRQDPASRSQSHHTSPVTHFHD